MSDASNLRRYYPKVPMQTSLISFIAISFAVTVIYAFGLRNHIIRNVLLLLSLGYPAVLLLSYLGTRPKLNYTVIDSNGIDKRMLGIFHRYISWSDIDNIDEMSFYGIESIGIMCKPTYEGRLTVRNINKRMYGRDFMIPNAYSSEGKSLAKALSRSFKKYSA